jgi:hypothetical protein
MKVVLTWEWNKLCKRLCIKPGLGKAQATIHVEAQALKTKHINRTGGMQADILIFFIEILTYLQ